MSAEDSGSGGAIDISGLSTGPQKDKPDGVGKSYEISDNVAVDLVKYIRSNTVKNEQQFLLATFGYTTGYLESKKHNCSGVLIGTSSSGKSHVQARIEDIFPEEDLYMATAGSDKSLIYDNEWNECYAASMDELQKVSDEITEFLKAVHGDDDSFVYKLTAGSSDEGADRGVDTIERKSMPYWFLYAQWNSDFEMWNRLMKLHVYESETKNRAVGATKFDHEGLQLGDGIDYIYEFEEGKQALQDHIVEMRESAPKWVFIPNGLEPFDWDVWPVMEPIFNHKRSESNRVYGMVASLIRSSALWNWKNREIQTVHVPNVGSKEVIIAEAQDVANVLSCRDALLATTHELDSRKKEVLVAIETKGGALNECTLDDIREYLVESDASLVKRSELELILEDLVDNYLVYRHEKATEDNKDLYEFLGWMQLDVPNVELHEEVFKGCTNPVTGEDFLTWHKKTKKTIQTNASELMVDTADEVTLNAGGQRTLTGGSSDAGVKLDEHEEAVRAHVEQALNGKTISGLDDIPIEKFLGLVPLDASADEVGTLDTTGTILDPEHEIWYQPSRPENWVDSETDARVEIERAVRKLISERIITTPEKEMEKGQVVSATISVLGARDI